MRRPGWTAIGALVALAFVCSSAWPLLTYTTSLAAFGLWHVASEMRYVRERFGQHMAHTLGTLIAGLLVGVLAVRGAMITQLCPAWLGRVLELGLVTGLVACVVPKLWSTTHARWLGAALGGALATGILLSPVHTLLVLAVAHNFTPVGFLVERAPPEHRARTWRLALLVFVGLPLCVASGLPQLVMESMGWFAPDVAILPVGVLADHLGAYFPPSLHHTSWITRAFCGVVMAQCLHYIAVIVVLPQYLEAPALPKRWIALGALLLALTCGAFVWDFAQARVFYGMASAVHAWIELPLLLLAMTPHHNAQASATQPIA